MRYTKSGKPDMRFKQTFNFGNVEYIGWILKHGIKYGTIFAALLSFLPFFALTGLFTWHLRNTYLFGDARRINDIDMIFPATAKCIIWSTLWTILLTCCWFFIANKMIFIALALFVLWFNSVMAAWLSIVYFGVVIDPIRNRVFFRQDQMSYDFMDYVKLKFFYDLRTIDSVKLSEIEKISKQYGDYTYLIGSFGSRRIMFSNKMKRDECIHVIRNSAITRADMMYNFDLG